MRVVVTGGAGFIGSAVCRLLVKGKNCHVTNIDCLTYAANLGSLSSISKDLRYVLIRADICDRKVLDDVLARTHADAILHLAAETHVDRSIASPAQFIMSNIVGTYTLLEAARAYWEKLPSTKQAHFRFLHVSTDEVYGSLAPNQFASERTAYDPRSPYAASKASADHLVAAWYNTYGLPVLITNSSNNYGPFQFPEKLIPLLTLNALTGRPLPIYGDGNQERDWLYVDDHANALIHVLEKGQVGQTYNIGSRTVLRNIEVVIKLCDILDKLMPAKHSHRRLIKFVPDRPGHDLRYAIDPKTIEADLGWKPKEAFDAGLQKTITWYLENEWWWRPLREEVYDGERLGINRSVNRE